MKHRLYTLLIAAAVFVFDTGNCLAMTATNGSSISSIRKGSDQPTGLFGGIRQDGTFEFRLSGSRGIKFYRLASNVRLSGFPEGQTLQNLTVGTQIRLVIENYRITVIEALGGQP